MLVKKEQNTHTEIWSRVLSDFSTNLIKEALFNVDEQVETDLFPNLTSLVGFKAN